MKVREGLGLEKSFSAEEMEGFLREIEEIVDLPTLLAEGNLVIVWQVISTKILIPSAAASSGVKSDLNENKINVLAREWVRWRDSQEFLQEVAEGVVLGVEPIVSVTEEPSAVAEVLQLLQTFPWPLRNDDLGRVLVSRTPRFQHDLESLTYFNLEKTFVRQLIRSYARDDERRLNLQALTKEELREAYSDFKPLAVKFGLVTPDNDNFYERILLEGNLFLPTSDGDEMISYSEGIGYLHYALSGLATASLVLQDIEGEASEFSTRSLCRIEKKPEYRVDASCFRARLVGQFQEYFANMPELAGYVGGLSPKQWKEFESNLENTVRDEGVSDKPIGRSDIVEMFILLQYLETVLQRFDSTGPGGVYDQRIDVDEALYDLFPLFEGTLRRMLGSDLILPLFTFMLKFGSIPDTQVDPLHELRFRHWRLFPEKWSFYADRSRMVRILSTLAKVH
jgi:hypothetical protein